jgi:hypothetical protein
MTILISEGVCNFCGETFSKSVITRHIKACRAEKVVLKAGVRRGEGGRIICGEFKFRHAVRDTNHWALTFGE